MESNHRQPLNWGRNNTILNTHFGGATWIRTKTFAFTERGATITPCPQIGTPYRIRTDTF